MKRTWFSFHLSYPKRSDLLTIGAQALMDAGATEVYAACTHGVLSGPAVERIKNSDLKEMIVTNTIPIGKEKKIDKLKVLTIAPLFAKAIRRINEGNPLDELFER